MITAHTELGSAQCEDGSAGTFRTPCAWTLWASKAGGMEGGTQRGNPVDPGASAGATPRWAFECAGRFFPWSTEHVGVGALLLPMETSRLLTAPKAGRRADLETLCLCSPTVSRPTGCSPWS